LQEFGYISLKGGDDLYLRFNKKLPKNFQISFDIQVLQDDHNYFSNLSVHLQNKDFRGDIFSVILGANANKFGYLNVRSAAYQANDGAVFREGKWHNIILEIMDDTVSFQLDKEQLFFFREPFPSEHMDRCSFSVHLRRGAFHFRNLIIYDFGRLDIKLPIRKGDRLYQQGLHEAAQKIYRNLLKPGISISDAREINYKIGMCFLKQGQCVQAREWIVKVLSSPGSTFWAQEAKIALLETDWKENKIDSFIHNSRELHAFPELKEKVREIIGQAENFFLLSNFLEIAVSLQELICELTPGNSMEIFQAQLKLANTQYMLKQYKAAEMLLQKIINSRETPENICFLAMRTLAFIYSAQNKLEKSDGIITKARSITNAPHELVWTEVNQAFNYRARGQMRKAIQKLEVTMSQYSELPKACAFAGLESALIFCGMGKLEEARNVIQRARHIYPEDTYLQYGEGSEYLYVPYLIEEDFPQAANYLENDFRFDDDKLSVHAAQGIAAGIMWELALQKEQAEKLWEEVMQKFPLHQCNYCALLAESLLKREHDRLEEMPDIIYRRSEMYYLVALLYEHRKQKERSIELLQLAYAEDKTLRWPAVLAMKKLGIG